MVYHLASQEELEQEGIWDFDRLSRPYIRQEILQVSLYTCLLLLSTLIVCTVFKVDLSYFRKNLDRSGLLLL